MSPKPLQWGRKVHVVVILWATMGCTGGNALVHMHCKCGSVDDA